MGLWKVPKIGFGSGNIVGIVAFVFISTLRVKLPNIYMPPLTGKSKQPRFNNLKWHY